MFQFKQILCASTLFIGLAASSISIASPVSIMSPKLPENQSQQIKALVAKTFQNQDYRAIKVQLIYDRHHKPDHLVVYLFPKKYHGLKKARINLNTGFHALSVTHNYHLTADDLAQQPGIKAEQAVCPDDSIQFIGAAPNDWDFEQDITKEVIKAAENHKLKTVYLDFNTTTRTNYLNYMSCPHIVGNFYDGDADPEVITTTDGIITYHDIEMQLAKKFHYNTTNIWLACEAYNDPIKSAVMVTAQSQKYAAGINDLLVGPSDKAAACAMEAAIDGKPIEESFQECYKKYDSPEDQWGIGGDGSDFFAQ